MLALFLTRGTPHTEAMIPLLNKHGVPLVAPSSGAMVLHQPVQKHIFNVRATYQREAEKAITHLHSMGITRIGLVYVDDSFGADGMTGAKKGSLRPRLGLWCWKNSAGSNQTLRQLPQSLCKRMFRRC